MSPASHHPDEQLHRTALFPDDEHCGAVICGPYRYRLWRTWDTSHPSLLWILLNPSTADGAQDDPTLRRLVAFSRSFGFGGLSVVNLFAWRATSPQALLSVADPIGPDNDGFIGEAAAQAPQIVVAWGNQGTYQQRDQQVLALLSSMPLFCLGTTIESNPVHPLYQKRNVELRPFASCQYQ
jgi:hypothetical protein